MILRLPSSSVRARAALLVLVALAACDRATSLPDENENGGAGGGQDPVHVVGEADVSINTAQERSAISPYIYGSNQDAGDNAWTVRRYGGNRTTGYNWENNFSNAGSDYQQSSDLYAITSAGIPTSQASVPGIAITHFVDRSNAMGSASIVTLQMAGYVAADGNGTVTPAETAPSPRWTRVVARKGAPFATTPDTSDDAVYMDEFVNFLVQRYGPASSATGVRWYSLDNEPALWPSTHPRIHPDTTGARELIDRSVALASAVKAVDPSAGIMGPALYGMAAYVTLQDAPDWDAVKGGDGWFIDYYLDRMKEAAQTSGERLLDVLDLHWYPEARGDHRITDAAATTPKDVEARLQAPRTLWDSTYTEDSWIGQYLSGYLPLLPTLERSIEQHYPGTKLSFSEYNYGGGDAASGGLAQADVLGIFGKYGVYMATIWGIGPSDTYTSAAFKLYRDYDGKHSTFGDTSVRASTSDVANTSVYASIDGQSPEVLHVILLNKNTAGAVRVKFTIAGGTTYTRGDAWGFDATSPQITQRSGVTAISGNTFEYVVPALSAVHLVLR
ncbi:MAG TPA: glycoside hydrolase family 44 protein [Longimicrobiaceae bacterium]|nr:glycoside hydrolase family 44 protein [Longimicrobiaceae bacterium]